MANFKEMHYAIMFKLSVLQGVFGERTTVFERCISIYESAMAALVKPPSVTYTVEQRDRDVDRLREAYVKVDDIAKREGESKTRFRRSLTRQGKTSACHITLPT